MAKPIPSLTFTGPAIDGVPADDLGPDELRRIAFIRHDPEDRPFVTADIPDDKVLALVKDLTATGSYSITAPSPAPKPED